MIRTKFSSEKAAKSDSWFQESYDWYAPYQNYMKLVDDRGKIDYARSFVYKRKALYRVFDAYKGYVKAICGDKFGYISDDDVRYLFTGTPYTIEGHTGYQGWRQYKNSEVNEALTSYRSHDNGTYKYNHIDDLKTRLDEMIQDVDDAVNMYKYPIEKAVEIVKELKRDYLFEVKLHLANVTGDINITNEEALVITKGMFHAFTRFDGSKYTGFRSPSDEEIKARYQILKSEEAAMSQPKRM